MTHILQWNLRGIKDKKNANYRKKVETVSQMLNDPGKHLIICLQETHIENESQIPPEWTKFSHMFSCFSNFATSNDTFSGSLIFINKILEVINFEIIIPGRVMIVKTKCDGVSNFTNYISFYGKASGQSSEKKAIIESILQHPFDTQDEHIFMGDYNFVTSSLDRNTNHLNASPSGIKSRIN